VIPPYINPSIIRGCAPFNPFNTGVWNCIISRLIIINSTIMWGREANTKFVGGIQSSISPTRVRRRMIPRITIFWYIRTPIVILHRPRNKRGLYFLLPWYSRRVCLSGRSRYTTSSLKYTSIKDHRWRYTLGKIS